MKNALAEVFHDTVSKSIAVLTMLVLFTAIAFIPNLGVLGQVFASSVPVTQKLLFMLTLLGSPAANATTTGFMAVLASVFLSGVVTTLGVYAFRRQARSMGVTGLSGLGMLSAFIGIGCASCGSLLLTALIPLFGIGAFVSILPLGGAEFSLLGIMLLGISAYLLLKQIAKPMTCAVQ